ncbi:uncharacterized protein LOC133332427 [Musca vetustissima]|uniref:uncharacterized protein LOC133332427 n=1 Tax=Musca vetustissima TaxID=27455 RepID=UPI002AB731B6|nr:uncharacterized protein LOC133332427 [Musca vetustissima]
MSISWWIHGLFIRQLTAEPNHVSSHQEVLPVMLNTLGDIIKRNGTPEGSKWLTNAIKYHLEKSECKILQIATMTYEHFVKSKNILPNNSHLAHIMGYCTEFVNIGVLMLDDIMDDGIYRCGHLTWYKLHGIGVAINDAFMIEHSVYALLKHYFGNLQCYRELVEIFHETVFIAACIQSLDMVYMKNPVNTFNMETYKAMAANKVSYDHLYLPFVAALYLAGFTDKMILEQSKTVMTEIGTFYQIKNDYMDCFSTLDRFGKIGTDIQDNKYSWLVVTAMERANEQQKQIIYECYGKKDPEKIQKVKDLYTTLDLPNVYAAALEESYNKSKSLIYNISDKAIQEILLQIANRIYCREK